MKRLCPIQRASLCFLLVSLPIMPKAVTAETLSDVELIQDCYTRLESNRQKALQDLDAFELVFLRFRWLAKKKWENMYHPLWDARQKQTDEFSTVHQTNGEQLLMHYKHEDEVLKSLIAENLENARTKLQTLTEDIQTLSTSCGCLTFENCLAIPREKMETTLNQLSTTLELAAERLTDISMQMDKTLLEPPSEHVPYINRLSDLLNQDDVKIETALLGALRTFREVLEIKVAPSTCCDVCTQNNIHLSRTSADRIARERTYRPGIPDGPVERRAMGPQQNMVSKPFHFRNTGLQMSAEDEEAFLEEKNTR